jgi:hypothetical protein
MTVQPVLFLGKGLQSCAEIGCLRFVDAARS